MTEQQLEVEMASRTIAARALISADRRHRDYSGSEYVEYCKQIRHGLQNIGDRKDQRIKDLVSFFEKKFVEEMEVLARISSRVFANELDSIRVEYVRNDPPDGIIAPSHGESIFIECTSARDSRWETFALENQTPGRIISLSGFEGSDIVGSRNRGYALKGMNLDNPSMAEYLCEADEDVTTIDRHRRHIVDKLEKKLDNEWPARRNWLSIYVNEFMIVGGSYRVMEPTLSALVEAYRDKLRSKHIEALIFISNQIDESGWFSFHHIE